MFAHTFVQTTAHRAKREEAFTHPTCPRLPLQTTTSGFLQRPSTFHGRLELVPIQNDSRHSITTRMHDSSTGEDVLFLFLDGLDERSIGKAFKTSLNVVLSREFRASRTRCKTKGRRNLSINFENNASFSRIEYESQAARSRCLDLVSFLCVFGLYARLTVFSISLLSSR